MDSVMIEKLKSFMDNSFQKVMDKYNKTLDRREPLKIHL